MEIVTFQDDVVSVMKSRKFAKTPKLDDEDRTRHGHSDFGEACLLTRNVLATDVEPRFIEITVPGWDQHGNICEWKEKINQYTHSSTLDAGLIALLNDLQKIKTTGSHSMLDKPPIICKDEFGRTRGKNAPTIRRTTAVFLQT